MNRFFRLIDVGQYKSVVCLNGDLPTKEFFDYLKLPIIATDAAANYLCDNGIDFEVVIGDMDGIGSSVLSSSKHQVKLSDQDSNYSDFQKALVYMADNYFLPSIILGMSGGYIDHLSIQADADQ
jgi:thiamine pyrophosphokinase